MELKATPEQEDFGKKYKNTNFISNYLIENYFKSVKKLLKNIPNNELKLVHEVGCGEGYSTKTLINIIPKKSKLSASEYVEKLIPVAQKRNPKTKIFHENVYQLKGKNNSFDLIFLLEVLEHLDYPDKALLELKRVSSRYLVLGVPREPIWRIMNMLRGKYIADLGNTTGHLNHWSRNGIIGLVEKYYGEVIAVENPLPWTILLAKK